MNQKSIRVLIVIICSVFVVVSFAPIFSKWWIFVIEGLPVEPLAFTENVRAAIVKRIDYSTSLFQTGILLMAGIWGLIFLKPENISNDPLAEWHECVMMMLASVALLSSFYSHTYFVWEMTSLMNEVDRNMGLIPDIDTLDVSLALVSQIANVVGASFIAGFAAISSRWIREKSPAKRIEL